MNDGVYFINAVGKGTNLEFIHLKTGKTRTIFSVEKVWSYGLSVSPDNRSILCSFTGRGPNDLTLVENFR